MTKIATYLCLCCGILYDLTVAQEIGFNESEELKKLASVIGRAIHPDINKNDIDTVNEIVRSLDFSALLKKAAKVTLKMKLTEQNNFRKGFTPRLTGAAALQSAFSRTKRESVPLGEDGTYLLAATNELLKRTKLTTGQLDSLKELPLLDQIRTAYNDLVLPFLENPQKGLRERRSTRPRKRTDPRPRPRLRGRGQTMALRSRVRTKRQVMSTTDPCPLFEPVCISSAPWRTIDGSCNNVLPGRRLWGRAFIPFRRYQSPVYESPPTSGPRESSATVGQQLPNARVISIDFHEHSVTTDRDLTHSYMVMQWGQFVDHDITATASATGYQGSKVVCCVELLPNFHQLTEAQKVQIQGILDQQRQCFSIKLDSLDPLPDPDFRPCNYTRKCMNFVRSLQVPQQCGLGKAEQLNQITAYIDASNVYGSDLATSTSLRFGARLTVTASPSGDLLPQAPFNSDECLGSPTQPCFKAGDERVNELTGLTSMHTLWMREHNRIVQHILSTSGQISAEVAFQRARQIVIAEIQVITYKEFLPIILGPAFMPFLITSIPPIYFNFLDASIVNSFAAATYRFGHSLLNRRFHRHGVGNSAVGYPVLLRELFFNPSYIYQNMGIDDFIRGLLNINAQKCDRLMSEEITGHLFEIMQGEGFDLPALNIQRGRDHGLPGYNAWRGWLTATLGGILPVCNLPAASSIASLPNHGIGPKLVLGTVYSHVDDIDLFTGGVSETPMSDAAVGPTFGCLMAIQFFQLKYGDRFWYKNQSPTHPNPYSPVQIAALEGVTLSNVICANTGVPAYNIQPEAFRTDNFFGNSRVACSSLSPLDLTLF